MNILILTEMWPARGGQFVKDQVRFLKDCTPTVLRPYFDKEKEWYGNSSAAFIKNQFTCFFDQPKHNKYFSWIILAFRVLKSIKKNFISFDVIHAHFGFNTAPAAALVALLFKKKLVVTLHGTDVNHYLLHTAAKYSIRWALRRADAVICVADYLAKKVSQDVFNYMRYKIWVVNNGFDPKLFYPYPKVERDACRELYKVDNYDKVFLFVGNLEPVKNVATLITAFADFLHQKSTCTNSVLLIIGEGSERKKLQNMVSSLNLSGHVRFIGQVPHQEIPKYMNAADFLVLPSLSEGNPCVVIEALACGLSTILSKVPAHEELLYDKKFGGVVIGDHTCSAGIVDGLNVAVKNYRNIVDRKKSASIAENFCYENQSKKLIEIYNQVMET